MQKHPLTQDILNSEAFRKQDHLRKRTPDPFTLALYDVEPDAKNSELGIQRNTDGKLEIII